MEDLLRALQFSPEAIFSTLIAPRKDIAEEQKHLFLMWYLDLANLLQQPLTATLPCVSGTCLTQTIAFIVNLTSLTSAERRK